MIYVCEGGKWKRETRRGRESASVWQATLEHLKCSAGHAITYISLGVSAGTQRILSKVDERKTEKWKMEKGEWKLFQATRSVACLGDGKGINYVKNYPTTQRPLSVPHWLPFHTRSLPSALLVFHYAACKIAQIKLSTKSVINMW